MMFMLAVGDGVGAGQAVHDYQSQSGALEF